MLVWMGWQNLFCSLFNAFQLSHPVTANWNHLFRNENSFR